MYKVERLSTDIHELPVLNFCKSDNNCLSNNCGYSECEETSNHLKKTVSFTEVDNKSRKNVLYNDMQCLCEIQSKKWTPPMPTHKSHSCLDYQKNKCKPWVCL